MKILLSLLFSLSVFPLVSTARTVLPKPIVEKSFVLPHSNSGQRSAFPAPAILIESEACNTACLNQASRNVDRETVQTLNRIPVQKKEDAEFVGTVIKNMTAVSASLQNKGLTSREAKSANNAIAGAGRRAVEEGWEPETKANVIEFTENLALDPVANREKLEEVKENCRL
ncbi:MAG: hypothetical protein OXN83_04510 [Oligoflexia bacterium]|nr:hypothetical protein [Oligoflexia bacterium]